MIEIQVFYELDLYLGFRDFSFFLFASVAAFSLRPYRSRVYDSVSFLYLLHSFDCFVIILCSILGEEVNK